GVDAVIDVLTETEDAERHPWVRGRDRDVDRRAIADLLPASLRRVRVEDCREEDRAAVRIEVEDLRRGRGKTEAVLGGPLAHLGAAAFQHGDVERVDTNLEEDLCRRAHRVRGSE